MRLKKPPVFALFAICTIPCAFPGAAEADLTIVSQISVTGAMQPPTPPDAAPPDASAAAPAGKEPVTMTTYFKGRMARTEDKNGVVTIYDGVHNQVYKLDPAAKKYINISMRQAMESAGPMLAQMPEQMKFDAKIVLTRTEDSKTLAEKSVQRYAFTGTATLKMEGGFPGGGGGFPGGGPGGNGGFPGGGPPPNGGMPNGGPPMELPTIKVSGEYWLADNALLPEGSKSPFLPLVPPTISEGPFVRPLYDRLGKLKRIPLASSITLTMQGGQQGAGQSAMTIVTEVQSVSDAPLADALFQVPSDYHKVAAKDFLPSKSRP